MRKIICILISILLLLSMAACAGKDDPSKTPDEPTPAETPAETPSEPAADAPEGLFDVVSECGDDKLTNQLLNYYYWLGFSNFYSEYQSKIDIKTDTPLAEQEKYGGGTWQDYFIGYAVELWQAMVMFRHAGEDAGYVMDEEYAKGFETFSEELAARAEQNGCADIQEYLTLTYGEGADYDSYYSFYYDYYYSMSYYYSIYNNYYDEFKEAGRTLDLVTVRHILIAPEADDEAAWDAAKAKADALLDEWRSGEATEDSFAALVRDNTSDFDTRENGGLYENMTPGTLSDAMDEWCFDESRRAGDAEVVPSRYGYHVAYFVSTGEAFSGDSAAYLAQKAHAKWADAYAESFKFTTDESRAVVYVDFK